jgi:hypothetical protein
MVVALLNDSKTQTRRLNEKWLKRKKGDVLWVRETYALEDYTDFPDQIPTGRLTYREDWGAYERILIARYRASEAADIDCDHERCQGGPCHRPWHPSIHMPRWACRIRLQLTDDPYLERLQDISEADAKEEGVKSADYFTGRECILSPELGSYRLTYQWLWDSLNSTPGKRWVDNPHVIVMKTRIITP